MNNYYGYIANSSQKLIKKYKTRNPFEIAEKSGIQIIMFDGLKRLKGMYRIIKRNRFIILYSQNSTAMNRIVCAH